MRGRLPETGPGPDRVLGLLLLAVGLGVGWLSLDISTGFGQRTLSPRTLPLALCGLLAIAGAYFLIAGKRPGRVADIVSGRLLGFVALILVYFVTFPYGDFRIWTFVFLALAMAWLGFRRPIALIAIAAVGSLGLYTVFRHGFGTFLPVWF